MYHYALFKYAKLDEHIPADLVEIKSRKLSELTYPNLDIAPYCYCIKIFDSDSQVEIQNYRAAKKFNEQTINIAEPVFRYDDGSLYTRSGRLQDEPFKQQYSQLIGWVTYKQYILKPKYGNFLFIATKSDWLQNPKRIDEGGLDISPLKL